MKNFNYDYDGGELFLQNRWPTKGIRSYFKLESSRVPTPTKIPKKKKEKKENSPKKF